jgi:hypothetical protein
VKVLQSRNKHRGFLEKTVRSKIINLVSQKEAHNGKVIREKVMIGVFSNLPNQQNK